MTWSADERSPASTVPFRYCWPLEVCADTHLLTGAPLPLPVDIGLLALGHKWKTGVVLRAAEAGCLLTVLSGAPPAEAASRRFEPGWLTLCGHAAVCQVKPTSPVGAACARSGA